jgi:hypothetical protein
VVFSLQPLLEGGLSWRAVIFHAEIHRWGAYLVGLPNRTRGRQKRVVRTISESENAPKGIGWRQTGVYSQAPERQKAKSGYMLTRSH